LFVISIAALFASVSLLGSGAKAEDPKPKAKNIILFIGDGAGYNSWVATAMYLGRYSSETKKTNLLCDTSEWLKLACATYPLSLSTKPRKSGQQEPELVYDPKKAWDAQEGYAWLRKTATDSAGAGTAMSTGALTYNNAINWSDLDQPLAPTLVELAKRAGKSTGVVTSVQWSHATPATLGGAKVPKRDDYETIARQMLTSGTLDVIMGAGHPEVDNNGQPLPEEKRDYRYVGGKDTWQALEAARATPGGTYQGFRPVVTQEEFAALCSGQTPSKVVGTAKVATTLQASRSFARAATSQSATADELPFTEPFVPGVPSLSLMVKGALNILDDNPNGFYLMIEGGAIDWANHANRPARMIEEMIDFLNAIETAVAWVEKHSNWSETLVIIVADHETGLIWGPDSDKVPFQPLVDRGPGKIPGLRYSSTGHSNSLVPLYARGAGAELFRNLREGNDPIRGPYVHLTSIFRVISSVISAD
jgi:alkaline phosphatase